MQYFTGNIFSACIILLKRSHCVQYESRRLFVEVEKANLNVRKLEFENAALQVEKRAQATPLRIEKLAKERLNMRSALPSVTQYIQNGSNDDAGAKK